MNQSKIKSINSIIFLVYLIIFGLIFLPFPLHNSFIGNIDIWFYVWQWNDFFNHLTHQTVSGQVLYPEENYQALVGASFGYGLIFSVFKIIFNSDVWTMYAVLVFILALNALAFSLVLRALNIPLKVAVVLAFCLFANNYVLSNLENFNAFTFFPGLLAFYFLIKSYDQNQKLKLLYVGLAGLLAGLQVYYSVYLFLFQSIFWLALVLSKNKNQHSFYSLSIFLSCLILVVFSFFMQRQEMSDYLSNPDLQAMLFNSNESHSIYFFKDWFRVNFGNILYPAMKDFSNPWRYGARSAFFGFTTYLIGLCAFVYFVKNRKWKTLLWVSIVIVLGMLVSTGPLFRTNYYSIKTPIGWLNEWVPKTLVIRHLFRAHLITIAGILILIGLFLKENTVLKNSQLNWLLVVFVLIFAVENIPFKSKKYNSSLYTTPPSELVSKIAMIPEGSNLFFMPSCHILESESQISDGFNPMNREYLYMVWKNYLPYNIYNGRMGYLTNTSYNNTILTCNLNQNNYETLMRENDIDYFVIVRDFVDEEFLEIALPTLFANTKMISKSGRIQIHQPK